jgi:hypothetical protein
MNRRQERAARRRQRRHVPPGTSSEHLTCCGRRPHVEAMTAQDLHNELVADAIKGHATDLARAVAAYERIGKQTKKGAEAAFQEVRAEVASLTGRPGMPIL